MLTVVSIQDDQISCVSLWAIFHLLWGLLDEWVTPRSQGGTFASGPKCGLRGTQIMGFSGSEKLPLKI